MSSKRPGRPCRPPRARQHFKAFLPRAEALEERSLPSADPFASPAFRQQFAALLGTFDVPQASLAAERDGQVFTYTTTNGNFFSQRNLPPPNPVTPDSLFRIGSITKSFTAVALMTLVQQGALNLADSALTDLGYKRGDTISGNDPTNPIKKVSALLPDQLFDISVADLMDMTSGLPLDVPVKSQTFPGAPDDQVVYSAGSYAALAFEAGPPYAAPATSDQQIHYYLYEVANEIDNGTFTLPTPGSVYEYSDTGYTILGNIVQRVAQNNFGLSYTDYLQQFVLGPMGIAAPPPAGSPVSNAAMVALGHTKADEAYPTEVHYYTYDTEPPRASVFPDPSQTVPPFYPTDSGGNAILVPEPYGGGFDLESHFGNGGLVATPTALVKFFTNLGDVLAGRGSGPLTQQSVMRMVAEPPNGEDLRNSWYGLGWQVYDPGSVTATDPTLWFKSGALPGNSGQLYRNQDGTVWAAAFNSDVTQDGTGSTFPSRDTAFSSALRQLVDRALAAAASGPSPTEFPLGASVSGFTPVVNLRADGATVRIANPFPGFTGEIRRAAGDLNGDNVPDIVWAAGPGGGPEVKVFDGATGVVLADFYAFAPTFTGGIFVALGDVNGDGHLDIIVGAGAGGGPEVKVIDGTKLTQLQANGEIGNSALLADFYAFAPTFGGGVSVAAGDVNGDGQADVIAGAGPGGGPEVKVIDGTKLNQPQANGEISNAALLADFYAYDPGFGGGVFVAAGDVNGDGQADVIVGAGPGNFGPIVRLLDGTNLGQLQANGEVALSSSLADFAAYAGAFQGGVRVDAVDVNGDGKADIITGAGPGGGPEVKVFRATDLAILDDFFAQTAAFTGGVYV
jgi:CubicO group peptidase (beta-lactamase class C family)